MLLGGRLRRTVVATAAATEEEAGEEAEDEAAAAAAEEEEAAEEEAAGAPVELCLVKEGVLDRGEPCADRVACARPAQRKRARKMKSTESRERPEISFDR
eukprot:SAG11_NODE_3162_length_2642_cov_2.016516_1_plen_100_part_00